MDSIIEHARSLLLALFLLTSVPTPSFAGADNISGTVQDLYQKCTNTSPKQLFDEASCMGYVAGIGDLLGYYGTVWSRHKSNDDELSKARRVILRTAAICGNPTYGAMEQAFLNWAKNNPEKWNWSQAGGVASALRERWPCKTE